MPNNFEIITILLQFCYKFCFFTKNTGTELIFFMCSVKMFAHNYLFLQKAMRWFGIPVGQHRSAFLPNLLSLTLKKPTLWK